MVGDGLLLAGSESRSLNSEIEPPSFATEFKDWIAQLIWHNESVAGAAKVLPFVPWKAGPSISP